VIFFTLKKITGLQNTLAQSGNLIVTCAISDKMKRFNLPNLAFSFEYYYGRGEYLCPSIQTVAPSYIEA
jgi:hypothetical protein